MLKKIKIYYNLNLISSFNSSSNSLDFSKALNNISLAFSYYFNSILKTPILLYNSGYIDCFYSIIYKAFSNFFKASFLSILINIFP